MQIVLYYDNQSLAKKIEDRILANKREDTKILHIDELSRKDLMDARYIYVEWGLADFILKNYWELITKKPMGFYNDSFISDIDDCDDILKIMGNAVKEKRWRLCKSINEFLMYGDLIRKRKELKCLPSKIQIESTDLCNARCIMCSHAYDPGSGVDLFESGILEKLNNYFPFLKEVVLHGNGEPFIVKKIVDYLKLLGEYDIKFIANTNLSVVSEELLRLFEANFIELNISCDGHTRELYESIRCGLSFDVFTENVKKVRKECPTLYMKMDTVVMRQNLYSLEKIVVFASELAFDEIVFNMLCVDKRNNNTEDSPLNYINDYQENVCRAVKMGTSLGIKVTYFDLATNNKKGASGDKAHVFGICDWLVEGPYVDLRGQVGLCCINQNYFVGDLQDRSFEQIWNGEKYQALRTQFYNGVIPDYCYGCDFLLQERLKYMISYGKSNKITRKREREIYTNE